MKPIHRISRLIWVAAFLASVSRVPAQDYSAGELRRRAIERRGVEAAIWGTPLVSFDAMRQAFFRDARAQYGDILYFSEPADSKFQVTTPNASSLYVYFNFNLKNGPVVIELPPAAGAGIFGSILDAWQTPLADVGPEGLDRGKGGKYLLLPPDFKGRAPPGAFVLRSATYNGYALFRAIPRTRSTQDRTNAVALVKRLHLYPLSQSGNPAPTRFIDIAGTNFDGIVRFDDSFYDSLARMVNEEPVQTRDLVALQQLRSIGIEKGGEFKPDPEAREILRRTANEAHAGFTAAVERTTPRWPNAKWGMPLFVAPGANTGFTFQTTNYLDIDCRGDLYFNVFAAPKRLGAASFYLTDAMDQRGAALDGAKTYHLRVPPNVPAKQFWAVTVYDLQTAAFIASSPSVEINSYQDLHKNGDGSVDIFFGPTPPAGKESNWISTAPGRTWFAFFRFYGPEQPLRDNSWSLPDIEELSEPPQPTGQPIGRPRHKQKG